MEYTVIACLCTVIGTSIALISAIAKPLIDNTKSMTRLTSAVETLTEMFKRSEVHNTEAHKRIHNRIDTAEDDIKQHERRISKLEGANKDETY